MNPLYQRTSPRKDHTSFWVQGRGQSRIAITLSTCRHISPCPSLYPRFCVSLHAHSHLVGLRVNPAWGPGSCETVREINGSSHHLNHNGFLDFYCCFLLLFLHLRFYSSAASRQSLINLTNIWPLLVDQHLLQTVIAVQDRNMDLQTRDTSKRQWRGKKHWISVESPNDGEITLTKFAGFFCRHKWTICKINA